MTSDPTDPAPTPTTTSTDGGPRTTRRTAVSAAAVTAVGAAAASVLAACGGGSGSSNGGGSTGTTSGGGAVAGRGISGEMQRFASRPDLRPPAITVLHAPDRARPGSVFLGPRLERGNSRVRRRDETQSGAMVIDERSDLVWFRPTVAPLSPYVVRTQTYRGRPVLTMWQGTVVPDHGPGEGLILDDRYRRIATVRGADGLKFDFHEFLIGPDDTAFVISYPEITKDLREVGGTRRDRMLDAVVQEIDVATGDLVFQWRMSDHVALRESYESRTRSDPWDAWHMNSIDVLPGGDLLLSVRHTNAVYRVARPSGRIVWRLNGKRSDFRMGRGARFTWQHDARRRADGAITIFDNHARQQDTTFRSRAIALRLDARRRTAELVEEIEHPGRGVVAATQGGVQNLGDGHAFVGWGGGLPDWSEHADGGERLAYHARFAPDGWETYQTQRAAWTGRPETRPAVVASRRGGGVRVATSWNGASEVARWIVLGGRRRDDLTRRTDAARDGFETTIDLADPVRHVAVEAMDAAGRRLGRSRTVRVGDAPDRGTRGRRT